MKEQMINNIFSRISYTPYDDAILDNLGSISKEILIKEINVLFPKIVKLNNNVLKIQENNELQRLINEERYQNLDLQDEKEIFISYQLLFNYTMDIGKALIRLKNTMASKSKYIIKCLKELNDILDLMDHQTDVNIKNKLNIGNYKLIYIKLQNKFWRIDEYIKLLKNIYSIYEGHIKSIYQYCLDITNEAQ